MEKIFSFTKNSDTRTSISFDIDPDLRVITDLYKYNDGIDPHRFINNLIENSDKINQLVQCTTSEYFVESQRLTHCINNGFFSAIFRAWCNHENLTLSPDNFWYQIIQEVGTHINKNSKKFKSMFTDSVDKVMIEVNITDKTFDDGVDLIVEELKLQVKDQNIVNLFTVPFSTTTPLIQTCYGIALMNTLKTYFTYKMTSMCGIRGITLQGKKSDWIDLQTRINILRRMPYAQGIESNLDAMSARINKIINSYNSFGIDKNFWRQIVSRTQSSGVDYVTGWITDFFIYDIKGNYIMTSGTYWNRERRINTSDIPSGYCITPFILKDKGVEYDMRFYSGQSGIQFMPDGSISPSFFRAIITVCDLVNNKVPFGGVFCNIPETSWRSSHTMPDGKCTAPGEWKYAEDGSVIRI